MAETTSTGSESTNTDSTSSEATHDVVLTTEQSDSDLAASQGLTETIDDKLLMGFDPDETDATDDKKADTTDDDETADDKTADDSADDKKADDTKEDEKKATESDTTDSSDPKAKEVPKGYVKLEALHEARGENRFLKERLATIEQQLAEKPKVDPVVEPVVEIPEFKVLSEEELTTLAEDNPVEAVLYVTKLNEHNALVQEAKRVSDAAEQEAADNDAFTRGVVNTTTDLMETALPGIFDADSTVQSEIVEFADSIGFADDMFYLTNPETQVILPGEDEPLLLGEQAASILTVLVNARTQITEAKGKETTVDEKAIEARIRKEVEADLLAKFKKSGGDFKSLDQIDTTNKDTNLGFAADAVLSDAEFAKLTPAEQETYLSGV